MSTKTTPTNPMRQVTMPSAGFARAVSTCANAYPWSVVVDAHSAQIGEFGDIKHLTTRRPKEASR
jgi:hypothetical protein